MWWFPFAGAALCIAGAGFLWSYFTNRSSDDLGSIPLENVDHYVRTLSLMRDPSDPESFD